MIDPTDHDLLTPAQAAELTGYSTNAIWHWMATRALEPALIAGTVKLVRRDDVLALVAKRSKDRRGGPRGKKAEEAAAV